MALKKLNSTLFNNLEDLRATGRDKGEELVIKEIKKPAGEFGARYILEGHGDKEFIKMNKQFEDEINTADNVEVEKLIKIHEGLEEERKKMMSSLIKPSCI